LKRQKRHHLNNLAKKFDEIDMIGSADADLTGQPGLLIKLDNARVLEQLLKVLQFRDEVQITANSSGLKITAEVSRSFFGSAFVQKGTFSQFQLNRPKNDQHENNDNGEGDDDLEMQFTLSLFTLLQCLNITGGSGKDGNAFGISDTVGSILSFAGGRGATNPSLLIHHPEEGQPVCLWLEEQGGVVTKATIPTIDTSDRGEDFVDFAVMMQRNNSSIAARTILQAEHLCNIMSEFDPRSEFLKMRVDPKEKVLSMAAKSNILQEFAVDVPSQSDIVQSFQIGNGVSEDDVIGARYQFSLLKHALKPMSMAEKVSIRFDSRQFLSLQYMIKLEGMEETTSFIEFYCAPEVEDDDQLDYDRQPIER